MHDTNPGEIFAVFNEIGIIEQLSRARLEARLPDGLIAPHFTVLNHLMRVGDGTTPLRMARAFQVPKTTLTHTLKGLETRALIEMRPNPEDGRSKTVWITDAGRTLRNQTIGQMAPDMMRLLEGFDVEALIAMRPVLSALRELLDDARSASD